jgi:hypothetical protein
MMIIIYHDMLPDVNEDPVVIIDGLTKNFRLPGWRTCWVIGPKNLISALSQSGAWTFRLHMHYEDLTMFICFCVVFRLVFGWWGESPVRILRGTIGKWILICCFVRLPTAYRLQLSPFSSPLELVKRR